MKLFQLNEATGVEYILGGDYMTKKVAVLRDPTLAQAKQLMQRAEEGVLRGMVSTYGELYVWPAHLAEHYDTADQLGIEIVDQWSAHDPRELAAHFQEWQHTKLDMKSGSLYR